MRSMMIGILLFVIMVDIDPMPPRPFPQVHSGGFLASGKTLGRDFHQSGGTGEWWSEGLGLTGGWRRGNTRAGPGAPVLKGVLES